MKPGYLSQYIDRLRCCRSVEIDCKIAELRNTWKSLSYVRGGEGFDSKNFVNYVSSYYNSLELYTLANLCVIGDDAPSRYLKSI
jgi:hypothetical protein